MDFKTFKTVYEKNPVLEYVNKRAGKEPLATIKVVTYNHAKYISTCLDSLLKQKTNFDFEILIAEDESSDGTREICKKYAEKNPHRIRLLLNSRANNIPINGKPSGTFNSVYANFSAKGKYITTIEGDDYLMDEKSLQKRVEFLENNEQFVACFHNTKVIDQETSKEHHVFNYRRDRTIKAEDLLKVWIHTASLLYRHNLVNLFDEDMKNIVCGDFILRGKLAEFGAAKYIYDVKPAVYRKHNQGIFSPISLEAKTKLAIDGLQYLLNHYKTKKSNLEINKSASNLYLSYFVSHLIKDRKIKLNYLKKSFLYGKEANYSPCQIIKEFLYLKLYRL
ncbi:glycosyltransferase family 2 protein [Arenibacter aquaticus]|uniref:Glycosyltransferase family 2 protein n=1 Tax=Arenibacter aquaticus TaxID=2489054 RepID=A0A430K7W2_9FLAO|nr:glycosyltransferase family A protein [Arenibacter aquaticus]RTE55092.1 glycosyltransferase family 2 protein [Arenibacter aquaticus]